MQESINGYNEDVEIPVPDYRMVSGQVKSHNPYNGLWMPVMWSGDEPTGFSRRGCGQSIPELEGLLEKTDKGDTLTMAFSPKATAAIMRAIPDMMQPPVLFVAASSMVGIVERVRNLILDWTLKLEEQGILGGDMTFTRAEIQSATSNRQIIISNFQGILGDVSDSSVTQNLSMDVRADDFESLAIFLKQKGITTEDIADLKQAVANDPKPTEPTKLGAGVSHWMGKMIQKAASGAWTIGLGAAGKLLADAITRYYGLS